MIHSHVCDIEKSVNEVLSYEATGIKHIFKVDTISYAWVKTFLKDQAARAKIETLMHSIRATNKLPIHRDELRNMFLNRIAAINKFRVDQMTEHLKNVQANQDIMINEAMLDSKKFFGAHMHLNMIRLSDELIESIFSRVPEGVTQKEKDKTVNAAAAEIKALNETLNKGLNVPERWVFTREGKPMAYPGGCRWWAFVQVWKKVAMRFSGPVDIEGYSIENQEEMNAYVMLGFEKLQKDTPLQKPRNRNRQI